MPLDDKRRRATDIVVNDGSLEELAARVQDFWRSLMHKEAS
jgi:hypothetical protein